LISQINNEERDYKLEAYDYLLDPSLIASKLLQLGMNQD